MYAHIQCSLKTFSLCHFRSKLKTEANSESKIMVKPQLSSLLVRGHPVLSDQRVNGPAWPAILLIALAVKYLPSNSTIRPNY